MPKEFDPMAETNKTFDEIIQQHTWSPDLFEQADEWDLNEFVDNETPVLMEYFIPGPIDNVFIRISLAVTNPEDRANMSSFISSLQEFLQNEDEKYG